MKPLSVLTICLLSLSTLAFAQPPQQSPQQPKARFDCSQAKDPKLCEERRSKMRAARDQADKACQGKQGVERRECMRRELCAQSKDPKGCEDHAAKMKARMQTARKACEGQPAGERRECVRQEMRKQEK